MVAGELFALGLLGVLVRRNIVFILMSIEIMLNAAASRSSLRARAGAGDGQIMFIFILTLAAAEVAVGLALILQIYHRLDTLDADAVRDAARLMARSAVAHSRPAAPRISGPRAIARSAPGTSRDRRRRGPSAFQRASRCSFSPTSFLLRSPHRRARSSPGAGALDRDRGFTPSFGLDLDALSLVMVLVVTIVGFLIHLYSTEFMAGRRGLQALFRLHESFVGGDVRAGARRQPAASLSRLGGRRPCSYLLIGFWYRDAATALPRARPSWSHASATPR